MSPSSDTQLADIKEMLLRFHREDREDRIAFKNDVAKKNMEQDIEIAKVRDRAYNNIPPLTHYIQLGLMFVSSVSITTLVAMILRHKGI